MMLSLDFLSISKRPAATTTLTGSTTVTVLSYLNGKPHQVNIKQILESRLKFIAGPQMDLQHLIKVTVIDKAPPIDTQ